MSEHLGKLLFDSTSPNTGDAAIGIANEQILRTFGIESSVVDPFSPSFPSPLLIGGGEIVRTPGDDFYDNFRRPGNHILNAAGVWQDSGDLSYLREYSFVSARSTREVETLRKWVPDAKVIPCATTILESERYLIPGLVPGEPVVGIHLVPHTLRLIEDLVPIINAIPHKKVFIPFTHYNSDASFMRTLPFDQSNAIFLDVLTPRQLRSVFGQLTYAVVSSLHASIFSYSQNIPFASVYQTKAFDYFHDRGLAEHLVRDKAELVAMIDRLDTERFDFVPLVEKDRALILETFAEYARILRSSNNREPWYSTADTPPRRVDSMLLDQAHHVVRDRDLALSDTESRRAQAQLELENVHEQVDNLSGELTDTELQLHELRRQLHELRRQLHELSNSRLRRTTNFIVRNLRRLGLLRKG